MLKLKSLEIIIIIEQFLSKLEQIEEFHLMNALLDSKFPKT